MRFKSENQLREYWEKERKNLINDFLKLVEKKGKNKDDVIVEQFMMLFSGSFIEKELEVACRLYREDNLLRTDVEVSKYFQRHLKPLGEIMLKW